MWIQRDFSLSRAPEGAHPIKILKGPRQVGKTTLLQRLSSHQVIYFDDLAARQLATEDPRFFLDQLSGPLVLDEAHLAPPLFIELKRRVDESRRDSNVVAPDVWITGSNQTLLHRSVRESLAGRASYFDLNTLSAHELSQAKLFKISDYFIKGGWPQLYQEPTLDPVRYLNDLLHTFVEKDIVMAAGIEKRAAFSTILKLLAARVGQLFNASDIARNVGVEVTTVQSWCNTLEENGILRRLTPWYSNRNQRLIKAPKFYLEDVGLAVRLQGWTSFQPLMLSPTFGSLFENAVFGEISRFFAARGESADVNLLRTKDGVKVDFLVHLGNRRAVAIEVKSRAEPLTKKQDRLLDSIQDDMDVVERWIVSRSIPQGLPLKMKALLLQDVYSALGSVL